jgi:hypothetical protein
MYQSFHPFLLVLVIAFDAAEKDVNEPVTPSTINAPFCTNA